MSKLRNIITQAAELAGARGAFAEQATDAIVGIFNKELSDPKSAHRWREGQSIEDRLFLFRAILRGTPGVDQRKVEYIDGLVTLYAYSCAVANARQDLEAKRFGLSMKLAAEEVDNPEVAQVLSVTEASVARVWD